MTRSCPHSDTVCPHGMGCTFSCATGYYNGTKVPLPLTARPRPELEAVARIIDPHAWSLWPDGMPAQSRDVGAGRKRVRAESLDKASAILGLGDKGEGSSVADRSEASK